MINNQIFDALAKIYTTSETTTKAYRQVFTYEKINDTGFKLPKELLTYNEGDAVIKGRGKKYIEEITLDVFKEKTATDYVITVIFDFYGKKAEEFVTRLINIININGNTEFSDEGLTIFNYNENKKNLTDLENSKYKERFQISVDFKYTNIVEVGTGYVVKTAEADLVNADD